MVLLQALSYICLTLSIEHWRELSQDSEITGLQAWAFEPPDSQHNLLLGVSGKGSPLRKTMLFPPTGEEQGKEEARNADNLQHLSPPAVPTRNLFTPPKGHQRQTPRIR
jgi:hypothetical protein